MPDVINEPRNVAIVAVHGISDHVPFETARCVADALLALGQEDPDHLYYEVARETYLRIPVRPIAPPPLPKSAAQAGGDTASNQFEERSDFVLRMHARKPATAPTNAKTTPHPEMAPACGLALEAASTGSIEAANFELGRDQEATITAPQAAHAAVADVALDTNGIRHERPEFDELAFGFMKEQLEKYVCTGSDRVYETTRIETERVETDPVEPKKKKTTTAHIYEMYWSDLLRPKMGMTRIFGELYQTLFHLCHLGRQTIDFAFAAHSQSADKYTRFLWVALSTTHRWAVRSLTLAVPVLNLFLIALLVLIPLATLSQQTILFIVRVIPIAALVSFVGWVLLQKSRLSFSWWFLVPFVVTAVAFGVTNAASNVGEYRALYLEGALIAAVPVGIAINFLNSRRPGAWAFTRLMAFSLSIAILSLIIATPNSEYGYVFSILRATELVFCTIVVAWLVLLVCNWLAIIAGIILVLLVKFSPAIKRAEAGRIRRAIATGLLSLSLPTALFLLITLLFYSALARVVGLSLNPADAYPPTQLAIDYLHLPDALHPTGLFNHLMEFSSTPIFLIFLTVLGMGVLIAFWGLFPVVCFDLFPRIFSRSKPEYSGKWLDNGYLALSFAALCLFTAAPFLLSLGIIDAWTNWLTGLNLGQAEIAKIWGAVGALLVGSAVGLLAFHGRLEMLALGFRPLLNAILDIDNYLREFPRDAAPRARICARYASLLRLIQNWRDENGQPYDQLVVIAHSQGTVISVELLRYLQQNRDLSLERVCNGDIPITLLTVGCPLRQLYGWRFPHLYGWARHSSNDDVPAWFNNDLNNAIAPDPALLGVRQWINAYGSADYVGRHLWRSDRCAYRSTAPVAATVPPGAGVQNISTDPSGVRREFCIGPVAHNQYFASHSLPILQLDDLVRNA